MAKTVQYQCVNCGEIYKTSDLIYLCPECSKENGKGLPLKGVLKVLYSYDQLKNEEITFENLKNRSFLDLLPIENSDSLSPLKVGNTPIYNFDDNFCNVFYKFDPLEPTFSFKDRASDLVSAVAKERGIDTILTASTGNAASSLSGICASQKQKAILFVPASAPKGKLTQIDMYGGTIVPVDGTYDDAFDLSVEISDKMGWYNRNTAYNPFTVEGKKSVSFELFDQFNGQIPERIYVPTGDGVIISGVYKGLEDLLNLGILDKMAKIIAVQAEGSGNLVNNLDSEPFCFDQSETVADSISVDIPRNFFMARDFILKYDGEGVTVSDKEILESSKILSSNTGLFAEPASAAAYAGYLKDKNSGNIKKGERVLILLTGSGLKDIEGIKPVLNDRKPVKADIESVLKYLGK